MNNEVIPPEGRRITAQARYSNLSQTKADTRETSFFNHTDSTQMYSVSLCEIL